MMEHILIFAGTTEGREAASWIIKRGYPVRMTVCTATEYGKDCVSHNVPDEGIEILAGRMNETEMESLLRERQTALVIDATHPFAREVTKNIQQAAKKAGADYIRLLRAGERTEEEVTWADSVEEAVQYLAGTAGNILITTGSKELEKYTLIPDYKERCFARVLSTEEAVIKSIRLGFVGKHLCAMQGPFSAEMNLALLHQMEAVYFVTKESGTIGGYEEKLEAAKKAGASLVVVRRPKENGSSMEELQEMLERRYRC